MDTIDYLGLSGTHGLWGDGASGYCGETFVATATSLSSVEFRYDLVSGSSTFTTFSVIVAKYTETGGFRPTELLWESEPVTRYGDGVESNPETIKVDTGGLTLEPGERYVVLFNANAEGTGGGGIGYVSAGRDWENPYADGYYVFGPGSTGSTQSDFLKNFWLTGKMIPVMGDMAFRLTFGAPNARPLAQDDRVEVSENGSVDLWAQVLGNDVDTDAGDSKAIQSVDTSATKGSVVFDATSQTLRYLADADSFDLLATGETATDTFAYTVADGAGATSTATVTVTITGAADGRTVSASNKADVIDAAFQNGPTTGEDTITGGNGDDLIYAYAGADRAFGGNGNDTIFGGTGIDSLSGDNGDDSLDGGSGADQLDGGKGNDLLAGGAGSDTLTGGQGEDRFIFAAGPGGAGQTDVVTDFSRSDRIVLQGGLTAVVSAGADVTGDGRADTVLDLSDGSKVVLDGFSGWKSDLLV